MPERDARVKARQNAYAVLREINAPARLIRHAELVGEAADQLIARLDDLTVKFDKTLVLAGVVLHDAGKTLFPEEFDAPGEKHESAGRELLTRRGVPIDLARCCVSHAQWKTMDCSLEELLIALADKLWKGKREPELEAVVVDRVALRLNVDRWEVFIDLDSCFEQIAAGGPERLERSKQFR
ncbi:MAG TPA: HD domain-containing protein [Blastocatellia bacterium]|nr:HD domain-containing protein [Blastocatellia bacterium]